MGYAIYDVGPRIGGYGVPSYCEQPECTEEIDRGMSYACGDEPFSMWGCDRYFCEKHRHYTCTAELEEGECSEDCDDVHVQLCEKCQKGEAPFPYKPEHPTWVKHLLTDASWAQWRKNNPGKVKELKKL